MMVTDTLTADELARRRSASRRLAWGLGAAVLALYLIGLLVPR